MVLITSPIQLRADFRQDYDHAYQTYKAATTPAEIRTAARTFQMLADRKDAGNLKVNSLYWLAECWYDLKEYLKALNCFERALLYPMSNKEEAARFKVAVCYARLEWNEAARWELSRFLRDYPSSQLAGRVRQELQKIK